MKLVSVKWEDSYMVEGWTETADLPAPKAKKCTSVGFLLADDPLGVTIAGRVCDDASQACGIMFIPHGAIEEIRDVWIGAQVYPPNAQVTE